MATTLHLFLTALWAQIRFRALMLKAWATTQPLTLRHLRLALTLPRVAGADGADDDDSSTDGDDDKDGAAAAGSGADDDDDAGDDDDAAAAAKKAAEPNWKQMARKHEREAKKARKDATDAAARLKAREDADKSEQEKAIEEARDSAKKELQGAHEKERRQDRLEAATAKIAGRALKIGSGDDEKTVRFADPDDAQVHIERAIRDGDLDEDELFDANGRVKSEQLTEALTELLERKPHLATSSNDTTNGNGAPPKVRGSADGGKGSPKGELTVEDRMKQIRRTSRA